MTAEEFQIKNSAWLKTVLTSNEGQMFLAVLHGIRPPYVDHKEPHLYAGSRDKIQGYELCLRNIVALMSPPKPVINQPKANYQVEDPK